MSISVIGHDGGPLTATARERLAAATLVVGGARHLAGLDTPVETVVMGNVDAAVARLVAHDGPAVVLASGDPGFFGIVRALRRAGLSPEVVPAVSSVARAFARLGLPWDDALVVSAHGRDLRRAVNACRAYRKVAVLTGPGAGPAELAAALRGLPRRLFVAAHLGQPSERAGWYADGDTWPDPNVVVVLGPASLADGSAPRSDGPAPWVAGLWPDAAGPWPGAGGWALPETGFVYRDSMITKSEVRAVVLARLAPRLGELVWDVGAGSGSVAVECARFGAATIAVERSAGACGDIAHNAAAYDVDVAVVHGTAPAALDGLPDADAVFVGGGGQPVLGACLARRPARLVAAYAAVERLGPALAALQAAGYATGGVQLQANRLSPLPDGTHRLAATNPVHVVWGVLP